MQAHHKFFFHLTRKIMSNAVKHWPAHLIQSLLLPTHAEKPVPYYWSQRLHAHLRLQSWLFHISNLVTRPDSLPIIGNIHPSTWKHMQARTPSFRPVLWRFALDLRAARTPLLSGPETWNIIPNFFPAQREENKETGVERNKSSQAVLQRVLSNWVQSSSWSRSPSTHHSCVMIVQGGTLKLTKFFNFFSKWLSIQSGFWD